MRFRQLERYGMTHYVNLCRACVVAECGEDRCQIRLPQSTIMEVTQHSLCLSDEQRSLRVHELRDRNETGGTPISPLCATRFHLFRKGYQRLTTTLVSRCGQFPLRIGRTK